jgi:prepilin peptidase CpaA
MTSSFAIPSAVVAISLIACVTDLRTRRIPNVLTFGAAIAGLVVHTALEGTTGALTAGGGWLTGLIIFLPFFALGGMGGGDVKLVAALGAWLGPSQTFWLAIYANLAGGALALCLVLSRGYLRQAFTNIVAILNYWSHSGITAVPGHTLQSSKSPRLAYAIPILMGTLVTLWL